jgi:hypothetical protein
MRLLGNIPARYRFLPVASRMPMTASRNPLAAALPGNLWRLTPPPTDRDDGVPKGSPSRPIPADREDLPYKVEIWNDAGAAVEQIVAVTANASIGYAAYYAATREFPDRHITLRHKNSVVARWSGPKH